MNGRSLGAAKIRRSQGNKQSPGRRAPRMLGHVLALTPVCLTRGPSAGAVGRGARGWPRANAIMQRGSGGLRRRKYPLAKLLRFGRAKKITQEWDSSRTKPDVARARQSLVCWILYLVFCFDIFYCPSAPLAQASRPPRLCFFLFRSPCFFFFPFFFDGWYKGWRYYGR